MAINEFSTETPENYQQKCCCALVLDVSGSMTGEPIAQMNEGLLGFYNDIQADPTTADRLEVSVIEFSSSVKVLVNPSLVSNFTMPTLTTKGTTRLVDGLREGARVIRERKEWYKNTGQPYYRPWMILMTDGAPDSGQDIRSLAAEIREGIAKKEYFFFAVGVKGADMDMLASISDPSMPPANLQGLRFKEFFRWLSASMSTVTNSKDGDKVNLPNPSGWMVGFSV
jgi:uncharacterized protein YegL